MILKIFVYLFAFNRDLRDNPVKCDCEFWKYWKILKAKGIEVRGGCYDSSPGLTGTSFQDLKDESFACGKNNTIYALICIMLVITTLDVFTADFFATVIKINLISYKIDVTSQFINLVLSNPCIKPFLTV